MKTPKEIIVLTSNRDLTPRFFTDRGDAVAELRRHYDYCAHQEHQMPALKARESAFVENVTTELEYDEATYTIGATGRWQITAWAVPQAL